MRQIMSILLENGLTPEEDQKFPRPENEIHEGKKSLFTSMTSVSVRSHETRSSEKSPKSPIDDSEPLYSLFSQSLCWIRRPESPNHDLLRTMAGPDIPRVGSRYETVEQQPHEHDSQNSPQGPHDARKYLNHGSARQNVGVS